MFRWAKASFRGKRKDESGKKEKKSLALEKKKSKNVFTACAKSGTLEPPYEKSGGTTLDSKKFRGSKESEDLSLRKRSSGSHATATRTQSLLVSNSPSESNATAARGKSDSRSMSELRDASSKQPENKAQDNPSIGIKTEKSDVGVDECIISATKKPCTSELPMNNCNGLKNDAQNHKEIKGTQSNGPITSEPTKSSNDITEAAPLNSANEVGDMHVKQPGKEGSVVPPPNEVTGKSRVGSVTRDDLPCDRLQSSVCGGPASEDSGGRSTLPTQLSQSSGHQKVSLDPGNSSKVPAVVEKSSVTVVKSLQTNVSSSAFLPKESVGKIYSSLGADGKAKSASDNVSEKCKTKDVAHDKKAQLNADVKQKNADALESASPDILAELEENIIASSDLPDGGVLSHNTVLYKQTEHGGKVTHVVGGASGKEITVTFGDDFNKGGELEEVVEKPIVKIHFTPLTADPPKKTEDNAKIKKEYSTTASNSHGGEKEFVLVNILADIVDAKVVDAPLSKKVLSVSKSKDGSIVRETGGTSGKEVNVTFQSAHFSKKGENIVVEEDAIIKERFSPLGSEDKLTLDNLPFRQKSVIESAVKRRFSQYDTEPSQNKAASGSPLLGKSEKELIEADLKEDLEPFWSELDSSLASAIASASKETKKTSPSPPVKDEVLHQEPVDHVRRSPKDAFDKESTHQPLQSSTAQVLRALDSLKKASTETAEKSSANVQLPSASAEIPAKKRSVSYSLSASSALLSKNGSVSFVKANTTQGPELFNKGHCSVNSEPLVVSTSSSSVSGAAKSETVSSTKAPLPSSTSTCVENTSVNPSPTVSPVASDPATAESPPSPSCDCDMNGQLSRTGRHRDKCVRFSSLDLSPHSRSVGCYPIKEEPTSPLRPAVVSKPSLPKLLSKGSELRATLAEEEEFDDIEIADERCSPIPDAPEKKKAEEPEISAISKSPAERHSSLGRRLRSEKNGIVANIVGNFESSPLQGSSGVRSPKSFSPFKPKEEFGSVKEHSKVTYTFSKDYDVSKGFKTDPKRETSPKPDKPVKDYSWIKHVENKEKKETSPKLEKILFDYKWIKPIEKVEKQTTFSSGDKNQKIKIADVHDSPASETKTTVKKIVKEEECVAPIQITVTEASPEKKTTVVENGDHDMSASQAENIPDVETTERVVARVEGSQITNDTKTLQTVTSLEESSNTSTLEMSIQALESSKIEPPVTTAKLPETSTEISKHDDEGSETEVKITPSTAPKLDSPEALSEHIPLSEDAVADAAKDAEIVDVQDEGTDGKTQTDLELDMNSDSSAVESKIANSFTEDEKHVDEDRPCISEPSEARADEEKKTSPPETEVEEADVKPPTVVQPSTEFYLNPCKELLASSLSNAKPETSQKKSLNPFGDSEDEAEETITVILSSSESPVRTPTKSLNPFDEEEEDELNESHENGESSPTGVESLRTSTPSPLPRTTVPPVPTPRASKQGIGGSNLSLHSLDPRNLSDNWPYTLKSPLNVSTLSTKSLNPFDESEEEEESRGSFQRHHMSNLSVQGDMRVNMLERGKLRGSLPARRKKRRAPLPPGMQAPSPSPAHGPLTSSPSTPVGLFRSATSSLQQSSIQESPIYETHRNGSLDRSATQKNRNLHESPVFGGRRNLASRSNSNSPNTSTNGLGVPMGGSRRSTWGSSPRKVPPPRPPPPSLSAYKNSK